MGSLRKSQYYFFGFLSLYMVTGIGALVLGNIWLKQSVDGAPREAVISRAIEEGKKADIHSFISPCSLLAFTFMGSSPPNSNTNGKAGTRSIILFYVCLIMALLSGLDPDHILFGFAFLEMRVNITTFQKQIIATTSTTTIMTTTPTTATITGTRLFGRLHMSKE
jgi:hypothetical protein